MNTRNKNIKPSKFVLPKKNNVSSYEYELSGNIRNIIQHLGEDANREGLVKTPERYAKALLYLTSGYRNEKSVLEDCANAIFDEKVTSVVAVNNIEFHSLCEHHLLPFYGHVSIAFLPDKNGKILGLSKFARLVDVYSRRLQVQERLIQDIMSATWKLLKPQGIAIRIEAQHMCMMIRGVEKQFSKTATYSYRGQSKFEQTIKGELKYEK
ncbi:MAG: GTP cyclohydrolase I FolE [Candidatus Pacebacteria bacterium]|nr:GTP cyclohydrolase I FolE [Candidatus Paceibacterota bacterium]